MPSRLGPRNWGQLPPTGPAARAARAVRAVSAAAAEVRKNSVLLTPTIEKLISEYLDAIATVLTNSEKNFEEDRVKPEHVSLAFDEKFSLGFPLLADEGGAVAKAYGVWGEPFGPGWQGVIRSSFLVDENGKLEGVWYKVSPTDTVPKAMEALV